MGPAADASVVHVSRSAAWPGAQRQGRGAVRCRGKAACGPPRVPSGCHPAKGMTLRVGLLRPPVTLKVSRAWARRRAGRAWPHLCGRRLRPSPALHPPSAPLPSLAARNLAGGLRDALHALGFQLSCFPCRSDRREEAGGKMPSESFCLAAQARLDSKWLKTDIQVGRWEGPWRVRGVPGASAVLRQAGYCFRFYCCFYGLCGYIVITVTCKCEKVET